MNNADRNSNASDAVVIKHFQEKPKNFGEFEETYGWIECTSTTYPGRKYYFNLYSSCSCWFKPLSQNIEVPRYRQAKCKESSFDVKSMFLNMLGDEEEKSKLSHAYTISTGEERFSDSTLQMSGYFPGYSEIKDENKYFTKKNDSVKAEGKEITYKYSRYCGSITKANDEVIRGSNKNLKNKNETKNNQSASALKKAKVCNLANVPINKRARIKKEQDKVIKEVTIKRKPEKIIYEMYGTKTINYDPDLELPEDVVITQLSDSSMTSFTNCSKCKSATNLLQDNTNFDIVMQDPMLSEISSNDSTNSKENTLFHVAKSITTQNDLTERHIEIENLIPKESSSCDTSSSDTSSTCSTCNTCSTCYTTKTNSEENNMPNN